MNTHLKSPRITLAVALAIAPAFALCHGTAQAQEIVANQDVKNRVQPGYEPITIPLLGLRATPTVTGEAHVTDNYRAVDVGRQSDLYFNLRPELQLISTWKRHSLSGRLYAKESKHATRSSEDAFTYGASAQGVYDFARDTQFHANLNYASDVESRSSLASFQGTVKPVRSDTFDVDLGISHAVNQLTLNGDVQLSIAKFQNGVLATGAPASQFFRNDKNLSFVGGVSYDLGNGIALTANAQYDKTIYDFRPGHAGFIPGVDTDRGSHGFNLLGGINLELSRLIFGTIQVGYIKRTYTDPLFSGFKGLSFKANLLWNVTSLTSLGLRAGRSVADNGSLLVAGNTKSDLTFTANHELYRFLLLTAQVDYVNYRPNGPGAPGNPSVSANEVGGALGLRYLVDRRFTINAELRHAGRKTSPPGFGYQQNSAFVAVKFAL